MVDRRHVEPITGNRRTRRVLGWYGLFHQAEGLVVAPGMPVGLSLATPPHVIFEAQRQVWMGGGQPYQPVPAVFFRSYAGSGLTIQCLARCQLPPRRTMASSIVGAERGVSLRPCS
jgi:hypothetical protein